jgi:predicted nuclease with TOPRIM domain
MIGQVENIEKKILQLVEELNTLRNENAVLSDENKKIKAEMAGQADRISELTERLSKTQQALAGQRGDNDQEGSQELRKQIDQYIVEIDKCIAWLQNA